MNKLKSLLIILAGLLWGGYARATGPSYIYSEMRPVAINDSGDVLCYTRFEDNEMGMSWPVPVTYGYRILSHGGGMTDYTIHELLWSDMDADWDDEYMDNYQEERDRWQSIFEGEFNEKYLLPSDREKYGFSSEGIEAYRVDCVMPLSEFRFDLFAVTQSAVGGGFSTNDYSKHGDKIHVLYDFGHIVILQNVVHYDPVEMESVGSSFDYVNSLFPGSDYDVSIVTGVVFKFE